MNRLARGAVAGLVGIASYVGNDYFVLGHVPELQTLIKNEIESCAARLGEVAVETAVIPEECEGYEGNFESVSITEVSTVPIDEDSSDTRTRMLETTYTLPSAAEFREDKLLIYEENYMSPSQVRNGNIAVAGTIATSMFFGLSLGPSRRQPAAGSARPS